jgi:2-iminobutanoate/2-iminopropanoate deaminase
MHKQQLPGQSPAKTSSTRPPDLAAGPVITGLLHIQIRHRNPAFHHPVHMEGGACPPATNILDRLRFPMHHYLLLAVFLPIAASAQSGRRGRDPNSVPGGYSATGAPSAPEPVVAPDVPVLEGLPHAVRVGYTVYVSGMVPLDSAGHLVGAGDVASQARQAVRNLASVMRAARGVPGDVVRATIYLRDLTAEKVAAARDAVLDGLDRAAPPALTVVGVSSLTEPGIEVMVDATGQLRSEFPDRSRIRKP